MQRTIGRAENLGAPTPPFLVAIAGGTSSGKTALARKLCAALPAGSASLLSEDSYFRDCSEVEQEARDSRNFDHPNALDSTLFAAHIARLRQGYAIEVPNYDFATHCRLPGTEQLPARRIVIVEGRLLLLEAPVRAFFDLTLYVDVDADLRLLRRLKRDVSERGRSLEQVERQYVQSVRDMHNAYVEPTKVFADVIVPVGADNGAVLDLLLCKLRGLSTEPARG